MTETKITAPSAKEVSVPDVPANTDSVSGTSQSGEAPVPAAAAKPVPAVSAADDAGAPAGPHRQNKGQDEIGYIEVADEVISIVASLAAVDVHGVVGMSTGFREVISKFFGKSNLAQGVRLKIDGNMVRIAVYVIVQYGVNIPEVALKIQKKVKEAVENMTEYEVDFVDVHVEGVRRRLKSDLEKSLEDQELQVGVQTPIKE